MKINWKKIAFVVPLCFAMSAWAGRPYLKKVPLTGAAKIVKRILVDLPGENPRDSLLLRKCSRLLSAFAGNKFTISGFINMANGANSYEVMTNVPFLFCMEGVNYYYRVGRTEMLNVNGYNLMIDHERKKILLSSTKPMQAPGLMNYAHLVELVKNGNFDIHEKVGKGVTTIEFVNDHHLTCKEYSVTFNSKTSQVTGFFTRLSDAKEPLNNKLDRIVQTRIASVKVSANVESYLTIKDVILRRGQGLQTLPRFKGYELITI